MRRVEKEGGEWATGIKDVVYTACQDQRVNHNRAFILWPNRQKHVHADHSQWAKTVDGDSSFSTTIPPKKCTGCVDTHTQTHTKRTDNVKKSHIFVYSIVVLILNYMV